MTTAAATPTTRDPFMPQRPPGFKSGLALALLVHALLIAGLAYNVDWHASTPEAVEAELWSALPQQAAPRPVSPPPRPAPAPSPAPTPSPPAPKPQPVQPAPPPTVDPQIAIEKARDARRVQQQEELAEQEQARRDKARRDQAKQEEDRKLAEREARDDAARQKQLVEKRQADREKADRAKTELAKADQAKADKAEAVQREKDRLAALKRMQSLAGATGEATATGSAAKSSGPSASYGGRVVARIKPNIVFNDTVDGNPAAIVEVKVAPDGTITGRRVVQSSGVKAWDEAVLRAIDRTDGLPRDIDGRVPPSLIITFLPRDR